MSIERAKTPARFISALSHNDAPQFCEACGLDSGMLHEGLYFRYKIIVCKDCANQPPLEPPTDPGTHTLLPHKPYPPDVFLIPTRYTSVTKTTAQKEYLLTNPDLDKLPHFLTKNPHSISYSAMKLYLLAHVAELSSRKFGSLQTMRQTKEQREFMKMDTQIKLRAQRGREELLIQQCYEKGYDQNATYMALFAEQTRFKTQLKQAKKTKRAQLREEMIDLVNCDNIITSDTDSSDDDHDDHEASPESNPRDEFNFDELNNYEINDRNDSSSFPISTVSTSNASEKSTHLDKESSKPATNPKTKPVSIYQQEVDLISSWFDPQPQTSTPQHDTRGFNSSDSSNSDSSDTPAIAKLTTSQVNNASISSNVLNKKTKSAPLPPTSELSKTSKAPKSAPSTLTTAMVTTAHKRKHPIVLSTSSSSSSSDTSTSSLSDDSEDDSDESSRPAKNQRNKSIKRQKLSKPSAPPVNSKSKPSTTSRKGKAKLSVREQVHVHSFTYQDGFEVCECGVKMEVEFL